MWRDGTAGMMIWRKGRKEGGNGGKGEERRGREVVKVAVELAATYVTSSWAR